MTNQCKPSPVSKITWMEKEFLKGSGWSLTTIEDARHGMPTIVRTDYEPPPIPDVEFPETRHAHNCPCLMCANDEPAGKGDPWLLMLYGSVGVLMYALAILGLRSLL